jgi:hypothetical protein
MGPRHLQYRPNDSGQPLLALPISPLSCAERLTALTRTKQNAALTRTKAGRRGFRLLAPGGRACRGAGPLVRRWEDAARCSLDGGEGWRRWVPQRDHMSMTTDPPQPGGTPDSGQPGRLRSLIPRSELTIYHGGHLDLVTQAGHLAPRVEAFLGAQTRPANSTGAV